jgi:outer membrane protein assembly factor BamB
MPAPKSVVSAVLVIGALTVTLQAQDWPHWRGPLTSGVSLEKGLPTVWSATQGVAWTAPIRGLGISSPIVAGGRVFVTSQVGSGVSRPGPRLVQGSDAAAAGELPLGRGAATTPAATGVTFLISAFDRASGKTAWEHEVPAEGALPPVHEKHNLASSSPVTDGQRVYAWFGTGQIVAVDLAGTPVWKRNLAAEYGAFNINWGHSSSPTVFKDMVILLCYHDKASYLVALDARTGANRWKVDHAAGTTSYSTPLVIEAGGQAEIVVNSSVGVSAYRASTGEALWTFREDNRFPVPMPLHHDGVIYASRGYRSSPFMAIKPGGRGEIAASGHVLWRVPSGGPYISSLVHYEGLIYMMGDVGVLTVTDAKTGDRVHQERLGGVYSASPVAADGKVYLLSEDGETIVLAAGRSPRVLARNRLNARQLASPAIAGGRLFIRSDDALFAIGK